MARLGHARQHFAAIITLPTAALLSLVALMSAWVYAESLPMQVYSTAIGEIRHVALDKWLSLRVNTGTAAAVTLGQELAEIALDHGEALFEMERESPRSLHVIAGSMVMSTRAAKFSVRMRDAKNMEMLVSTGHVTVGTTLVHENQMARISPDGIRLRDLDGQDVARRLEWTKGHIAFAGETLAEAVAEFNRYHDRKLVIADRTISFIPIGGTFVIDDVQSFVAALRPLGVRAAKADENAIRLVGSAGTN
jgi:transmembrane sensor